MSCNSEDQAQSIYEKLTEGEDLTIPSVDWNDSRFAIPDVTALKDAVVRPTNAALTERKYGGNGTFDALMESVAAHLSIEYTNQRLTGAEYSKAYVALTEAAMTNSVQFLVSKESSYWQAVSAQINAVNALIQLEATKAQVLVLQAQAKTTKAEFAVTKHKLANLAAEYCTSQYNLDYILPLQREALQWENSIKEFTVNEILPKELALKSAEVFKLQEDTRMVVSQRTNLLPAQVKQIDSETHKNKEQTLTIVSERTTMLPAQVDLTVAQKDKTVKETQHVVAETFKTNAETLLVDENKRQVAYTTDVVLPSQVALTDAQKSKVDKETLHVVADTAKTIKETTLVEENTRQTAYTTDFLLPAQVEKLNADTEHTLFTTRYLLPVQVSKLEKEMLQIAYTTEYLLPAQVALTESQRDKIAEDILMSIAQRTQLLPQQIALAEKQVELAEKQIELASEELLLKAAEVLLKGKELELAAYNLLHRLPAEVALMKEKTESERANTSDTRTDATPVSGLLGSQKNLYKEQIQSYRKDALVKMAKPFFDYEIAYMSVNELTQPNGSIATGVTVSSGKMQSAINVTSFD